MNTTQLGAEVTEDRHNYYIRIGANDRERAKRIPGRVWDPSVRKWICPRTPAAHDAICREFVRSGDLVKISAPPRFANSSSGEPAKEKSKAPPVWAKDLAGLPSELEDLKAQSAANAETLERILDSQRTLINIIPTPEHVRVPPEPEAMVFSRYLRTIVLSAAGDDPSLAALIEESFDIVSGPLEWVQRVHQRVDKSLREFVGETDPHTKFPGLVDRAENLRLFPERAPIRIARALKTMNHLRNLLVHEPISQELRVPVATLYFVNLAVVWPYFAFEQPPEGGYPDSGIVYADGRILPAASCPKRT